MQCVLRINTLCDSAQDDKCGEDACVRTRAPVKGPTPEGSSCLTAGLGQAIIFTLQHG